MRHLMSLLPEKSTDYSAGQAVECAAVVVRMLSTKLLNLVRILFFLLLGAILGRFLIDDSCNADCGDGIATAPQRHLAPRGLKIPKDDTNRRTSTTGNAKKDPPPLSRLTRPKTLDQELHMRQPLLIGVVTAQTLLSTRATAIYETWGAAAPKVLFFSSPGDSHGLPVVNLENVDDTYPPQKKVYYMLKYFYDNFLDKYNWFLRADDDVYVRVDRLTALLSKLDPLEPLYLGQPGMGKPEDRERLELLPHECYCMGGPGVVFSRGLLQLLGPHLEECLRNVVVSYNEDVEVGRCISRRVGIQCSWSYQMAKLFYMDYSKGEIFKNSNVYNHKDLPNVMSVHSFKQPSEMYRIHQFYLEQKIKDTQLILEETNKELKKWQAITKHEKAYV